MKREATPEQKAKADERRKRFRDLAKQLADMPPQDRAKRRLARCGRLTDRTCPRTLPPIIPLSPFLVSPPTFRYHSHMPKGRALEQAYQIRDIAAAEAIALKDLPTTDNKDRFARAKAMRDLINVWQEANERIRIARGKGLPKAVEASNSRRKVKREWPTPEPPQAKPVAQAEPKP